MLLLDKAAFPSDTVSTHYIHQPGIARLRRWGVLDAVIASNCPPARTLTLDVGPFALVGTPPSVDGAADAYAPRRAVLDKLLVDAAVAAGAELRERFTVEALLTDGDRVAGIRGHAASGVVTEQARIVIGADGIHSRVAQSVQAPAYNARPSLTCAYLTYWSEVPIKSAALYLRPDRMIGACPTNDGQTLNIVFWPAADFPKVRANIEREFLAALDLAPSLAERIHAGRQTERFRGTVDLPNFFRKPYGPGWALIGDAGYHKDPITAEGISDAFRDAELLVEALDDGFAGRRPIDEALDDYQRRRDAASMPAYELTCQFAALQPPTPEMQQLFAPENLGRVMAASAAGE